ncbi:MAG: DNA-binding protein [Gammaproteobacteria bacterium]
MEIAITRIVPWTAQAAYPRLSTIGNADILKRRLLGFFCSARCPGGIIVQTYDLARALRDAGVPVIGGFHSPMEKECLDLLLRGKQPIAVCPARAIGGIRLPKAWKDAIEEGRLLVVSPFESTQRRPTSDLADQRNLLVATIAHAIFVAYANPDGKTATLAKRLMAEGQPLYTLDLPDNTWLASNGAVSVDPSDLGPLLRAIT